MRTPACSTVGLATLVAVALSTPGATADSHRFSFATLEGEVGEVSERPGTGKLPLLAVELLPESLPGKKVTVLLGPAAACREIGLEVRPGDRVRVRVFVAEAGEPVKAQKILNLSRRMMVRLRTMHDIPLWNSAGAWQGGPGRAYHGGHHGSRQGGMNGLGPGRTR